MASKYYQTMTFYGFNMQNTEYLFERLKLIYENNATLEANIFRI